MNIMLAIACLLGFFTQINAVRARDPYGQEYNTNDICGRAPNRGGPGDVENYNPNEIWGREPSSEKQQAAHINMADHLPYPVTAMTYTNTINDQDFELNGTIEEAHAQIKNLHPGVNLQSLAITERSTASGDLDARELVTPPLCTDRFGFGNDVRIRQGVSYLRYQGGCSVGPTTCSRISCGWKSAVYLCNDNPFPITLTCNELSDYVTPILDRCWWKPDDKYGYIRGDQAGGQQFANPGLSFNVYVGGDSC